MRRVMPPQRLRIHRAASPPVCRLARGREGLSLEPETAPAGAAVARWPQIQLSVASPYPTVGLSATAGGAMVLSWLPGVVQSIVLPDLSRAFDRRPPGLVEACGAGRANAALLRADDGWRAVVLPSLGDRLSDLGAGPAAISASAQNIAVHEAGTTMVVPLAGGVSVAEYAGEIDGLAFAGEQLWLARGGAMAPAEDLHPGTGAPVRRLVGAAGAERVLALTADGDLVRCAPGEPDARWHPVIADVRDISLSDDGAWATLAGPSAVAVVRADDGAVAVWVGGASSIALGADRRIVVGGEWGMALIVPVEEST
jgi:hypothetical protein